MNSPFVTLFVALFFDACVMCFSASVKKSKTEIPVVLNPSDYSSYIQCFISMHNNVYSHHNIAKTIENFKSDINECFLNNKCKMVPAYYEDSDRGTFKAVANSRIKRIYMKCNAELFDQTKKALKNVLDGLSLGAETPTDDYTDLYESAKFISIWYKKQASDNKTLVCPVDKKSKNRINICVDKVDRDYSTANIVKLEEQIRIKFYKEVESKCVPKLTKEKLCGLRPLIDALCSEMMEFENSDTTQNALENCIANETKVQNVGVIDKIYDKLLTRMLCDKQKIIKAKYGKGCPKTKPATTTRLTTPTSTPYLLLQTNSSTLSSSSPSSSLSLSSSSSTTTTTKYTSPEAATTESPDLSEGEIALNITDQETSYGILKIEGLTEDQFYSEENKVSISVSGALFTDEEAEFYVDDNYIQIPVDFNLTDDKTMINFTISLKDGPHHLEFSSSDESGYVLYSEMDVWTGRNYVEVKVVKENNEIQVNASVTLRLTQHQDVFQMVATDFNGWAKFKNIPGNAQFFVEASGPNNSYGYLSEMFHILSGSQGLYGYASMQRVIVLHGFNPPSAIQNNDFSHGLDGWIVPQNNGTKLIPAEPATTNSSRKKRDDEKLNLYFGTYGPGEQTASRTFTTQPNTKTVSIRYRFITAEITNGYFGSMFNDYYRITMRTLKGEKQVTFTNTMNALGLGAFDSTTGKTDFFELELPVDIENDVVQIDLAVCNVIDRFYDSALEVSFVNEEKFSITDLQLFTIDTIPKNTEKLRFLSVDAYNPYYGGNNRIYGLITIEGAEDVSLSSIQLEVVQNGVKVATADLSSAVRSFLLNIKLGPERKLTLTGTPFTFGAPLLFELTNAQAAHISVVDDGTIFLRVSATTTNGNVATKDYGSVQLLARVADPKILRYGTRDTEVGGDDWVKRSIIPVVASFTKCKWNDFSKMNGGTFKPHSTHGWGMAADGYFAGYEVRNAAVAEKLFNMVDTSVYYNRITKICVTFVDGNEFHLFLKDAVFNDGTAALTKFRNCKDHEGHFHFDISPLS